MKSLIFIRSAEVDFVFLISSCMGFSHHMDNFRVFFLKKQNIIGLSRFWLKILVWREFCCFFDQKLFVDKSEWGVAWCFPNIVHWPPLDVLLFKGYFLYPFFFSIKFPLGYSHSFMQIKWPYLPELEINQWIMKNIPHQFSESGCSETWNQLLLPFPNVPLCMRYVRRI